MTTPLLPPDEVNQEKRGRSGRRMVFSSMVLLVVLVSAAAWFKWEQPAGAQTAKPKQKISAPDDTNARAPTGARVRVRVINATRQRGLAKRAATFLRDRGFDVVDFDSDPKSTRHATLILTHTGHPDWSERVQRALGIGSLDVSSDSSRYIDVTVLLGDDWRPTSQPFRP